MKEEEVAEALEEESKPKSNVVTLSSGVVLLCKQANPLVMIKVMSRFPRPKPPVWKNPTMGREMENPDDPDYIERVKNWEMENSNATLNVLIALGTELKSVPKGFPKPDDDSWIQEYETLGFEAQPNNPSWRYLNWVMFKAMRNEKDLEKIRDVVGRLSGVSESSVESAQNFSGSE